MVDEGTATDEESLLTTRKLGDQVKANFLQFVAYQKEQTSSETSFKNSESLEALMSSMTLISGNTNGGNLKIKIQNLSGLQWLPVPT